jgi:uncharacterized protein (DUF433 family)
MYILFWATLTPKQWIAKNADKFGGKPIIKGTRFTVSFILSCLAEGMTYEEIVADYSQFPKESLEEILRFASRVTDDSNVAA